MDKGAAVIFESMFPDTQMPVRATDSSAGYDLFVYLRGRAVRVRRGDGTLEECRMIDNPGASIEVGAGEAALLPLGFKARLPRGLEAQIRIRSSWAFKGGLILPNAPGTIDADYPDEWMVLVQCTTSVPTVIRHADRIAQAVLARHEVADWIPGKVSTSTDRTGGFGSTG